MQPQWNLTNNPICSVLSVEAMLPTVSYQEQSDMPVYRLQLGAALQIAATFRKEATDVQRQFIAGILHKAFQQVQY